jgi:hypothetical protein
MTAKSAAHAKVQLSLALCAVVFSSLALAQSEAAATPSTGASEVAAQPEATATTPMPQRESSQCERFADENMEALPHAPAWVGLGDADFGTGRRVCPLTEVGLGVGGGAIIDTPNYYGHIGVAGVLFGSYALNRKTELFGTLEMVQFNFVQNSALKQTSLNLGNLTVGATRQLYASRRGTGGATARLLLPTSFGVSNARLIGAELGHLYSFSPTDWGEVHTYLGVDFTAGLSAGPSQPRIGVTGTAGFQFSPASWFAVVVDVMGRYGAHTALSPSLALRFRIVRVAIDLSLTKPVLGSDRHLALAGLRASWLPQ